MNIPRHVLAASLLALLPGLAFADGPSLSLFQQGRIQGSITGGLGSFNDNNYFILGLGAGVFVADGLETSLNADGWFGNSPQIYDVSPQFRYIFQHLFSFDPYIGGLYRRT